MFTPTPFVRAIVVDEEKQSRPVDQRVTLFFPPAVLLATLVVATVLAAVSPGPASGPAGFPE